MERVPTSILGGPDRICTSRPTHKAFDTFRYLGRIDPTAFPFPHDIEEEIAREVLCRREGFETLIQAPDLRGVPFEYLGLREGTAYLITFRVDIGRGLYSASQVLKGRLTKLIRSVPGLEAMHVLLILAKGKYRLYGTEDLRPRRESFESVWPEDCSRPIVDWIRERLQELGIHQIALLRAIC